MKAISISNSKQKTITSIVVDIAGLALIYAIPTLSHILSLPLYLIEPMRIMLILTMVHTTKTNAIIIAITLPLFSFFISGHPVFPKMILIALELLLNVMLFYFLTKKINRIFPAIFISILLSKLAYYGLKFGLIKLALLDSGIISTPLYIQLIMMLLLSGYLYLFYKKEMPQQSS